MGSYAINALSFLGRAHFADRSDINLACVVCAGGQPAGWLSGDNHIRRDQQCSFSDL